MNITEQGTVEVEVLNNADLLNIRNVDFKAFKGQPPEVDRPIDDHITALTTELDSDEVPYTEVAVWVRMGTTSPSRVVTRNMCDMESDISQGKYLAHPTLTCV